MTRLTACMLILISGLLLFCNRPGPKIIYESKVADRYPGFSLTKEDTVFTDSIDLMIHDQTVRIWAEWNIFIDTVFQCRKVGDIRLYAKPGEAVIEQIELTPLPCAVDWFKDESVIFEKILIGGYFTVKSGGNTHTFEGDFCAIDGKGRLAELTSER